MMTTSVTRLMCGVSALAVTLFLVSTASAATIDIEFTGLDVAFDGTDLTDAEAGGPDALSTLSIQVDGVDVTGSPFAGTAAIDLVIPSLDPIPAGGGTVSSAAGGSVDVDLPGGDGISLTLGEATVTFLDLGFLQFAFAATAATVDAQSLPDGVLIGEPISFNFSTTVDSFVESGGVITSFESNGTGQISGVLIPEPTALLLLLSGSAGMAIRRRR